MKVTNGRRPSSKHRPAPAPRRPPRPPRRPRPRERGGLRARRLRGGLSGWRHMMQPLVGTLPHEEFWVLYLNNSNKVLSKFQISKGGITATLVDVRLLFKKAIEIGAVAIIICHNHPSGKINPSTEDKNLTKKIKLGGMSLDIKLLDHLIITEKSYFSFADNGEI